MRLKEAPAGSDPPEKNKKALKKEASCLFFYALFRIGERDGLSLFQHLIEGL